MRLHSVVSRYYGMEPASPDRLVFRASVFAGAPISQNFPPKSVSPARWWSCLVRAGGKPRIAERRLGGMGLTVRRQGARRSAC